MRALSRRTFARLVAGVGGTGRIAAVCASSPTGSQPTASGPPPSATVGVGFVLSHEQFTTAELIDQAQRAEDAGFQYLGPAIISSLGKTTRPTRCFHGSLWQWSAGEPVGSPTGPA